jgi:hypothetical protein
MQRLGSSTSTTFPFLVIAGCLLATAQRARAQVVLFDDAFGSDPLRSGWTRNGDARWVEPPGVAPDCHDGLHDPNDPGVPPCSLYSLEQLEDLGETAAEFGGYVLITPALGNQNGNAFRTERALYDNVKLEVVVEMRDGSIGRPADGMAVVIVGGDEPPSRTGTGGGGMGAPCVGQTDDQPMLAVELDDWSGDTYDRDDGNHVAFAYSPNGFPSCDAIEPHVFVPVDPAIADFHNQEPPPATPNRYRLKVFLQAWRAAGEGATVACDLEAIDGGVDLGRLFTQFLPSYVPFAGYLGVTASTGGARQNHILHSARLESLPDGFCLEPAAGAVRSIRGPRSAADNCGDFLAGDELSVTLRLANVRRASDRCTAAAPITVRDAPPRGWAVVPGSISDGGVVVGDGVDGDGEEDVREIVWTVMDPSEGRTLSYRVVAADSPDIIAAWGRGSVVEDIGGSVPVAVTGQSQVTKDTPFDACGGIRCWSLAGALRQPGGAAPGDDGIRRDYLTDGVTSDLVFNFAPGDEIAPDFGGAAASTGIFDDPNARNPERASGVLTVLPWNDPDATIDFNADVYGGDPDNVIAYAAVRVIAEEERDDIFLGVSSDDSVRVVLNGEEVHIHNLIHKEARPGASACRPQDVVATPLTLLEGANDLRVAVFEGSGGFNFALRFQDAAGEPITRGLELSKTADIGCRRPPVTVTRSVAAAQTVRIGPRMRPAFSLAGETFIVSLTVADPRGAAGSCSAAGQVTITDTVPQGWAASLPSAGGSLRGREVSWTIAAVATELSYQVTTGGAARNGRFQGSVSETGSGEAGHKPSPFRFGVRGDAEVVYVPTALDRGNGVIAISEDFNAGAEQSCPDNWTCNANGQKGLVAFAPGITQSAGHAGRLRLTSQAPHLASSVFWSDAFDLSASSFVAEFDAFFSFRSAQPLALPADGLTFCVLNAGDPSTSPRSLGASGGGMGYAGLNGFAVELDLWDDGLGSSGYNDPGNPLVLPFRDSWHDRASNEDQFNEAARSQTVTYSHPTRPSERSRPAARRASESI